MNKNLKKIEIILIFMGIGMVLNLIYKTSLTLKPWEDEIIALTSSINFYTSLDYLPNNSYDNYSYGLTSGILSSIGGVIGWIITKDLIFTRFFNFLYVFFVQFLMTYYIFKSNKNYKYLNSIFFGLVLIVLVPWWFSTLYLIAEVISTLIFVNALFLYNKNKKLSLFLMGCSVIFGKFLLLIPTGLFLTTTIKKTEIKKQIQEIIYYLIPFIAWYSLIFLKIGSSGLEIYFQEFIGTLVNRPDSGVQSVSTFGIATVIDNFINSEAKNWTTASILRTTLAPAILLFVTFKDRINIKKQFGLKYSSILLSIIGTFAWFWLLTPFKYIRQSTHFVLIVIFISFYLLLYSYKLRNIHKVLLLINLSLFLSDIKLIILFNILVIIYYLNTPLKIKDSFSIESLVIFLFVINLLNMNIEVNTKDTFNTNFQSCKSDIFSDLCVDEYLSINK